MFLIEWIKGLFSKDEVTPAKVDPVKEPKKAATAKGQIGRASCRERV